MNTTEALLHGIEAWRAELDAERAAAGHLDDVPLPDGCTGGEWELRHDLDGWVRPVYAYQRGFGGYQAVAVQGWQRPDGSVPRWALDARVTMFDAAGLDVLTGWLAEAAAVLGEVTA